MVNNCKDRAYLLAYAEAVKTFGNVSCRCSTEDNLRLSESRTQVAHRYMYKLAGTSSKSSIPPKSQQMAKRVHFQDPIHDEISTTDFTQRDHDGGDTLVDTEFTSYAHVRENTCRMHGDECEHFCGIVVEEELTATVRTRQFSYSFYDVFQNHQTANNGKNTRPPEKSETAKAGGRVPNGNAKSTNQNPISYKGLRDVSIRGTMENFRNSSKELFISAKDDPKGRPDAGRSSFLHHSSSTEKPACCPRWLCPCKKKKQRSHELMTPLILINYCKSVPKKSLSSWWIRKSYPWQPRHVDPIIAIHEGIFSAVTVVKHRKTGQLAAMKVIFKKNSRHSFYELERTVRVEKTILENARGNALFVNLDAFCEMIDRWCFFFEYLPLGDLAGYIQQWELDEKQLLSISAQVVTALRFLHKMGVIHRDVKSENVLLDYNGGNVKLIDFGLAHIGRTNRRICGTPVFMAPEMLLHREYNNSVDWWSLGVVIFECQVGCTPTELYFQESLEKFSEEKALEYCREGCYMAAQLIPDSAPPELQRLLKGFLELDPNKRLGCKPHLGFFEIWSHPYFSTINFEKLSKGEFCSCPLRILPQRRTALPTSDKV